MSNSSSNTFSESQLTECPLFALGCCTVENCSGSVTSRDLPDHIFGSKENGTIQLCSLAKQTSYLKAANQVLLEELQALKTESQRVKYVNFLAIKKEKEKGYEKLAALRAKTPPGFVTKKIDGKTTVFSGTVPDADLKHLGILVYQNGAVYHGEMLNFVASGIGIKKYATGASHNGGWQNGTKSGNGTYISANGDVLMGNFVNGLTHGKGKWTSADGNSVFEGEFVDDKKHGKGTLKIPGSVYEGEFENDLRHGKGTEIYTCGQKYVGDFVGGEKHGYGEYTWPAGELYRHYTGAFADGDLHGYGVLTFSDGRVYRGMFDSDFMHGPGKMKHIDGRMLAGVWRYDIQLTAEEEAKYYTEQQQKLLAGTGAAATADDENHEAPFAGLKLAEHMDGDAMKDKEEQEQEEEEEAKEPEEGDHDSVEMAVSGEKFHIDMISGSNECEEVYLFIFWWWWLWWLNQRCFVSESSERTVSGLFSAWFGCVYCVVDTLFCLNTTAHYNSPFSCSNAMALPNPVRNTNSSAAITIENKHCKKIEFKEKTHYFRRIA